VAGRQVLGVAVIQQTIPPPAPGLAGCRCGPPSATEIITRSSAGYHGARHAAGRPDDVDLGGVDGAGVTVDASDQTIGADPGALLRILPGARCPGRRLTEDSCASHHLTVLERTSTVPPYTALALFQPGVPSHMTTTRSEPAGLTAVCSGSSASWRRFGFAFDSYELLMAPLVIPPALSELLKAPIGSPLVNSWAGFLLYVPAVAGGIFGLIGGYLTDLFGRRRVLVWSILLLCVFRRGGGLFDFGLVAVAVAFHDVCRRSVWSLWRRVRLARRNLHRAAAS